MAPNGLEENRKATGRRPAILMGILLVLLLGYLYREQLPGIPTSAVSRPSLPMTYDPARPPRLKGDNRISGLVVKQEKSGEWFAEFDYYYNRLPQFAHVEIDLSPPGAVPRPEVLPMTATIVKVQPGPHHVSAAINYPGDALVTTAVTVSLRGPGIERVVVASQQVDQVIHWPTYATWAGNQQLLRYTPEQNLARAVSLIDSDLYKEAKPLLEKLLEENPRMDGAYVELARIAMKSNWSAEGLHQAQGLLNSALKIRPDSANAKILLGYVYTHQHQFARAEGMFVDAAASNPRNLWLWENWGELLAMQGKTDQAMAKYREAIARPMTHDTYDRARASAYIQLLTLLEKRKDFDTMEVLYKQRVAEFGPGACYSADYARFMLQVRGDAQSAIDIARRALNQDCEDSGARRMLGLAEYVKWASTKGPESAEALDQARIFLPEGANLLYLLATGEHTLPAARRLIADGEKIDQKDSESLTALALALRNHDSTAARRLLALGARPEAPVGAGDIPVALLPVLDEDIDSIRVFRQAGVDYSKLRYRGMTALEFAKRSGNHALLEALGGEGTVL